MTTLFAAANELLFANDVREDPQLFLRGLAFLARYVQFHFAAEEAAMARWEYESAAQHHQHHVNLTARVEKLGALANQEGPSARLRDELHRLMDDWVRVHVRVMDKDFIQHVARVRRDAAAERIVSPEDEVVAGDLGAVAQDLDPEEDPSLRARLRRFWS